MKGDRLTGVEALIRWEHPEHGMVSPGEFIPLAEESGLIVPIGEWVLHEACGQLARWRAAGAVAADAHIAVNVSAKQLCRPELGTVVDAALSAAGLEPQALCIEITESALLHGFSGLRGRPLRMLGVGAKTAGVVLVVLSSFALLAVGHSG